MPVLIHYQPLYNINSLKWCDRSKSFDGEQIQNTERADSLYFGSVIPENHTG